MTFDLPNLTAFLAVFFAVAAVAAVISVSVLASFFTQNHATRVRRHQSVGRYYGQLVLGH